MIRAIIGANYGDEGKGLAVNHFTSEGTNLVVRHNGGAQSGHTVELKDKRFVFHELSSGSFNNASTLWLNTYHPDLYTLSKEIEDFQKLTGCIPVIYAEPNTKITIIDDVFLNCFKETQSKNGSCGMGIWECVCRNNAGYSITIQEIKTMTVQQIYLRLLTTRTDYTLKRLKSLQSKFGNNNYAEMLNDNNILINYATTIKENSKYVKLATFNDLVDKFDNVIFESGQGLLLDGDFDTEHGTPSKTGLYNIITTLNDCGKTLDEAVYVTRTYLTRHGRGNFVEEHDFGYTDKTNVFNEWQEGIKYGKFDSVESLENRINADCEIIKPSIFVTHAMNGQIITDQGNIDIDKLNFNNIYVSDNRFGVSDIIRKYI